MSKSRKSNMNDFIIMAGDTIAREKTFSKKEKKQNTKEKSVKVNPFRMTH